MDSEGEGILGEFTFSAKPFVEAESEVETEEVVEPETTEAE